MCAASYEMPIDARKRGLTSILITKIGIPSKFARVVNTPLMEQKILENKHIAGVDFNIDNLSCVDHRID